jgi:predicted deacetylase
MAYGTVYSAGVPWTTTARLSGDKAMSVTVHDVAPATQARCEQLIGQIEQHGRVPMTLLVVPRYHHQCSTADFERWIERRLRAGDELALHGFTHLDEAQPARGIDHLRRRWYTAGEGEFAAIDRESARQRLEAGRRWFAQRGWPVRGFVAPAWLLGAGAWSALREQPFDYTCTLTRLIKLAGAGGGLGALPGRSIVFSTRSAWRRQASLLWNASLAWAQRDAQWMRFELHPGDVEHRSVNASVARLLARAFGARREVLTLSTVVERLR